MPDKVLVRFANISAPAVEIAVTKAMTVGQLKEAVWASWPAPRPEVATEGAPLGSIRITGHGRGELIKDSQTLGETSVFVSKSSIPLTTVDGSAVHLIALFRAPKAAAARRGGGGGGGGPAASSGGGEGCCAVM